VLGYAQSTPLLMPGEGVLGAADEPAVMPLFDN